jgi:hypothetical protein
MSKQATLRENAELNELMRLAYNDFEIQKRIELAHNARGIFYHVQKNGKVRVTRKKV